MALNSNALFATSEAARFLGVAGDSNNDRIEEAVNEASRMIEAAWGGPIIARGTQAAPLIEYHQAGNRQFGGSGTYASVWSDIVVNDWPLVSVSEVVEAGTTLVANTDYRVVKLATDPEFRVIRRLSGGFPVAWPQNTSTSTYRTIKITHLCGYRRSDNTTDTTLPYVPADVLRVGRELVAWIWRQRQGSEVGLTQISDATGNRTFTGPAYVTPGMIATLRAAGASLGPRYCSGERDS